MSDKGAGGFSSHLESLLNSLPLAPLGPGKPDRARRNVIEAACRELPATCQAGLWLAFDFLNESHQISQEIPTAEGSFWHAIMHRREPDSSNASYWFRRVGEHPILSRLAEDARELGLRLPSGRWNPFEFIDLCEQHRDTGTEIEVLLCRVQQREWERLFAWCYTPSVAGG